MPDLVSGGFPVPGDDLIVGRGALGISDAEARRQEIGGRFAPFSQAEQPVHTDAEREGDLRREMCIGETRIVATEDLRDGRPVDMAAARQPAARDTGRGHAFADAFSKQLCPLFLAHAELLPRLVIFLNIPEKCFENYELSSSRREPR